MGRLLAKRFTIAGTLTAATPVHVGGAGDDLVVDMPLARDGKGRVYIPGTSLAGPIRAWWSGTFGEAEARRLFGRTPDRNDEEEGHASYIRIEDAPAEQAVEEIRDGVGIDRVSGAAADGIKYDRAVATRAASFAFRAEIDVPAMLDVAKVPKHRHVAAAALNNDAELLEGAEAKFGALVCALEHGDIRFGAAKTRGLGRLELSDVCIAAQHFNTKNAALALVRGSAPPVAGGNLRDEWSKKAQKVRPTVIEVTITWRPKSPVMSKSGVGGLLVDTLPFVTRVGGQVVPVIAGSAIKGVLRSHAERIWRTLDGADARDDFIDQLEAAVLPNLLFGAVADARQNKRRGAGPHAFDPKHRPVEPGLGAVSIDDCVIGPEIPLELWVKFVSTPKGEDAKRLSEARALLQGTRWAAAALPIAHAAIDRWTGGAAESALFAALELKAQGPHTIRMLVDPHRIACLEDRDDPLPYRAEPGKDASEQQTTEYRKWKADYDTKLPDRLKDRERAQHAALALLLLTLRDVAEGRVPLGFGINRGLGSLEVDDITLKGPMPGLPQGATSFTLEGESRERSAVYATLNKAWQCYWEKRANARRSAATKKAETS